jgi:hypothetical protein
MLEEAAAVETTIRPVVRQLPNGRQSSAWSVTVTATGQQNSATLANVARAQERIDQLVPNIGSARDRAPPPHQMPGIRLPRQFKAAYGEAELFRQQANVQTFDMGLQVVLNTLLHAVRHMLKDKELYLPMLKFSINFGAPAATTKRYSVKVSAVEGKGNWSCQFDMEQILHRREMMLVWKIDPAGEHPTFVVAGVDTGGIATYVDPSQVVEPYDETARTRRIEL